MTTKRELLLQAAEEFGISSSFDLSPEDLQSGLNRLNRIAAEWDGKGIRVGFNFSTDLDALVGIPDTAENCFAVNLAVQWAAAFGKTVSPDTRRAATNAFNTLYTARGVRPEVPRPSHLPIGTGNRRGAIERQYFPESTEIPGLNDGATEY